MAIYHLHVKNISRRDGRSAVAAAAYRAGETLPNDAEEKDSAFGGKRDVVFTEIRLPPGAPAWMSDRAKLWNAVEAAEKRKDARLAKEIEFALPVELPRRAWEEVARSMADVYVTRGHVVDIAIHDDGTLRNPHVHLMLTTRAVGADGFKLKMREADGLAFVTEARQAWAVIANDALGKAGAGVEIDARSHAARGIDQLPTVHRGPDPAERRARRWGRPMIEHDTLEARRELLGEARVRDRFPLLSGRPDWPPERREPVPGLSPDEAREWGTFWREVDKRLWGPELYPPRPNEDRIRLENQDPIRVGEAAKKLLADVERGAAVREEVLEDLLPVWRELHDAVRERMQADGYRTDHPLDDWKRVEASLREFDAKLTELRLQEAERTGLEPVPDPDGRPLHPRELEEAEERLIFEERRPASRAAVPPRPERMPVEERVEARAAVDRQNDIEVSERGTDKYRLAPHEDRLDWLDAAHSPTPAAARREDRLDWLGDRETERSRTDGPERERDR
ncbi:MAG TPA: MobQ family relaxase [Rhodopseudomonas sp.]|uniref:MobQ family relaxase n=1 Tax=Rhodopseudomonas sp. TaxID=1078 RepID=UPI002ED96D87